MSPQEIYPVPTRILSAEVRFLRQPFVAPLVLSTGAIEAITQAEAVVHVDIDGRTASGWGTIYLSDLWSWPDPAIAHAQRDAAMRSYCRELATDLPRLVGSPHHPLALGLRLHEHVMTQASGVTPAPPPLARSVCASIFDAAIHDAAGRALGVSAFQLYKQPTPIEEADRFFGGAGETIGAIRALLLATPRTHSPAWWVIGKNDALERDVRPVVQQCGFFAFKLKIMGKQPVEDAARVAEVAAALRRWGVVRPRLTVDSNEANPDAASVMTFLDELQAMDAEAYEALELIEQPTGRDIAHDAFDWRGIAERKPVMVDEGLVDLASAELAHAQGWSGFALKTCKGHSFILTAAAWARQKSLQLSLQDLTNPGASAVHAALFAAHVPTLNGVELNSPQFTPAANRGWDAAYPDLFAVRNGRHRLPDAATEGLGGHRGSEG